MDNQEWQCTICTFSNSYEQPVCLSCDQGIRPDLVILSMNNNINDNINMNTEDEQNPLITERNNSNDNIFTNEVLAQYFESPFILAILSQLPLVFLFFILLCIKYYRSIVLN